MGGRGSTGDTLAVRTQKILLPWCSFKCTPAMSYLAKHIAALDERLADYREQCGALALDHQSWLEETVVTNKKRLAYQTCAPPPAECLEGRSRSAGPLRVCVAGRRASSARARTAAPRRAGAAARWLPSRCAALRPRREARQRGCAGEPRAPAPRRRGRRTRRMSSPRTPARAPSERSACAAPTRRQPVRRRRAAL